MQEKLKYRKELQHLILHILKIKCTEVYLFLNKLQKIKSQIIILSCLFCTIGCSKSISNQNQIDFQTFLSVKHSFSLLEPHSHAAD